MAADVLAAVRESTYAPEIRDRAGFVNGGIGTLVLPPVFRVQSDPSVVPEETIHYVEGI